MPTASDLVTDLPADFEVFGQAVATSLADLLGGTTGQVLAKASNTNMDFTWVTTDDANAIQNTIVDAKGDLIAATAADTPARLAVGTNGQVLTADSTAATGLAWATPAGGGGKVLQVVSVQTTTTTTIASTSLTDTGITASITPTLATSKILVIIAANAYASAAVDNTQVGAALLRGATTLQSWNSSKNFLVIVGGGSTGYIAANNSVVYLDSPATTSSTTYKLQANTQSTANSRQVVFQEGGAPGTITLMEIGA